MQEKFTMRQRTGNNDNNIPGGLIGLCFVVTLAAAGVMLSGPIGIAVGAGLGALGCATLALPSED